MFDRITSAFRWGVLWFLYAFSFLGRLIPKREGVWVFGADGGDRFGDNSKYLFLHVTNERPDVRAIWLTANDDVRDMIRDAGYESYRAGGLRGIYYTMIAEYAFVCLGRGDIAWWASGATTVVNLWHGCPLKRVGSDRMGETPGTLDRLIFAIRESAFDKLVTTANSLRNTFVSGFGLAREDIPVLGYPRNDVLRGEIPDELLGIDQETTDTITARSAQGPVIMYMPTYRRGFGMEHGETDGPPIDEDALQAFLDEHDATFLVKLHPHAQDRIDAGTGDRIITLPDDYDVYPALSAVDILVTDYSSIYLDFLHLDRPVVFYPYDLDAYEERPGFYFDYEDVTPGPTPQTFDGFLDALDETISGIDDYQTERRSVRRQFFDHPDHTASEKVVEHFSNQCNPSRRSVRLRQRFGRIDQQS